MFRVPCDFTCPKCGSLNVHRRYWVEGQDTNGPIPNRDGKTTDFVDRSDPWVQPAKEDCIVHRCRCCGYTWDTAPLD